MNFGKLKSLLNETFINFGLVTNSGIISPNHALSRGAISHIEIADKAFLPELAAKMNGVKLIFNN